MEAITNNSLLMMQRSMHYLWQKQTCILDNIANVETPNYKTKYVTFEESLENAIQSAAQQGNQGTTADIRQAIESAQVEVKEAQESTRMDDNGVNITEQAIELARNGYQLQYVMDSISSDFSMLRTAIRG
ncbi:MAG: flagellar basal body rod protein FlgB [Lawsonibacter sp.]